MERKRRRTYGSKEEFENRMFPWMCLVSLLLVILYVAVSIVVNPWLFVLIPIGICGVIFVGMVVIGIGAGLTSFLSTVRDFVEE